MFFEDLTWTPGLQDKSWTLRFRACEEMDKEYGAQERMKRGCQGGSEDERDGGRGRVGEQTQNT